MGVLASVLAVFTSIVEWIGTAMEALTPIFWDTSSGESGSLTFFGVLACCGLAVAIVLLLLNIVRSFLSFR